MCVCVCVCVCSWLIWSCGGCWYSQSLINLFLTSRAISNVWDNDKDVSGLSEYFFTAIKNYKISQDLMSKWLKMTPPPPLPTHPSQNPAHVTVTKNYCLNTVSVIGIKNNKICQDPMSQSFKKKKKEIEYVGILKGIYTRHLNICAVVITRWKCRHCISEFL